jgi:hypothetical protein
LKGCYFSKGLLVSHPGERSSFHIGICIFCWVGTEILIISMKLMLQKINKHLIEIYQMTFVQRQELHVCFMLHGASDIVRKCFRENVRFERHIEALVN